MQKTTIEDCKIAALFSLGMLDLLSTAILLAHFKTREVNPFMLYILEYSPMLFVIVKIISTAVCCGIFYYHQEKRIAKFGINLCLIVYSALIIWHLFLIATSEAA